MNSLDVDTTKLNNRAKESFANSLIDLGAGTARYSAYVILVIPAIIFVKAVLDEQQLFSFLWKHIDVLLALLLMFAFGMLLGAVFRNRGIMLLNELPDSCDIKEGHQPNV